MSKAILSLLNTDVLRGEKRGGHDSPLAGAPINRPRYSRRLVPRLYRDFGRERARRGHHHGHFIRSLAAQTGAGALTRSRTIELDMQSFANYWQPTAAFPTLDAYKDAVLNSCRRFGVQRDFACAKVTHHGK